MIDRNGKQKKIFGQKASRKSEQKEKRTKKKQSQKIYGL